MRLRAKHGVAVVVVLLVIGWALAPGDVRVDRTVRAPTVAASSPAGSADAAPRHRTTRPKARRPLVIHPPRAEDTASADAPFEVAVYFETRSGEQLARGYLVGCGYFRPYFVLSGARIPIDDLPCTATGLMEDGFLVRRSAPAEIDPETGDVTLTFPDERTGGIGIQIAADPRGILIEEVLPRGPAEALGLEPGDVVVAVEGKDAREISLEEFVETMTGPEGSDVEFELRAHGDSGDDAVETVKVTRRFLGT
jgi:hypothetical protein